MASNWRVGRKIPLNVYEGARPVCQCHDTEDAAKIVAAVNVHSNALDRAKLDGKIEVLTNMVRIAKEGKCRDAIQSARAKLTSLRAESEKLG